MNATYFEIVAADKDAHFFLDNDWFRSSEARSYRCDYCCAILDPAAPGALDVVAAEEYGGSGGSLLCSPSHGIGVIETDLYQFLRPHWPCVITGLIRNRAGVVRSDLMSFCTPREEWTPSYGVTTSVRWRCQGCGRLLVDSRGKEVLRTQDLKDRLVVPGIIGTWIYVHHSIAAAIPPRLREGIRLLPIAVSDCVQIDHQEYRD